jgi:glutaredoxin
MTVEIYGADWCGDCVRAKMLLDRHGVDYVWLDTDASEEDKERAREISGLPKIPVIVFPDGSFLSEPSNPQLEERLTANNLL